MTLSDLPVKLVLGDGKNSTYTGTIQIVPIPDIVNNDGISVNGTSGIGYDYKGAGMFCVVVIAVYALSIVLLIMSFVKKKTAVYNGEIGENETNSVVQYLIKIPDLKEKTARDNFRKLKNSIIDIVERSDERKASLAGITTEILHDLKDNNKKPAKESVGISTAILGAGMSLYQPLLSSNEMIYVPDENNDSVEATNKKSDITSTDTDEGNVDRIHRLSLPSVKKKSSQTDSKLSPSSLRRASASSIASKRVRFIDQQITPPLPTVSSPPNPSIPQIYISDTDLIKEDRDHLQSHSKKVEEPIVQGSEQKMDVIVDIWVPQNSSNSPRLVHKVIPIYKPEQPPANNDPWTPQNKNNTAVSSV